MALSNLSYDLVTTLHNKLEAVTAYDQYIKDCQAAGDTGCRQLFEEFKRADEQHVNRLRTEFERMVRDGKFQ
jgi:bacterioferritin (cytochrome b1)